MSANKSRGEDSPSGANTLDKGLRVLEAVEKAPRPLSIQEIATATGIQRVAVHRLVGVLEQRGYVRRAEDKRYRATARRRRLLVGYAAPLTGNSFRVDMTASLQAAAAEAGIDLMVLDNQENDAAQVMRNADLFINAHVDVAMFFQPVESLGHIMADRFFGVRLPFITIERPIQGGVYFGANNYQAGRLAGIALGEWARDNWQTNFQKVVLIEGAYTGTNVQARLAGVLVGLREVIGGIDESRVVHLENKAGREASRLAMTDLLSQLPRQTRLLVSSFNDLCALGALEAVTTADRAKDVVIVGQNAMREGRAELTKPGSPLIASVAYFPERYGSKLIRLASAVVEGDAVPLAVYTDHVILRHDNVDRVYPPV